MLAGATAVTPVQHSPKVTISHLQGLRTTTSTPFENTKK